MSLIDSPTPPRFHPITLHPQAAASITVLPKGSGFSDRLSVTWDILYKFSMEFCDPTKISLSALMRSENKAVNFLK